MVDSRKKRLLIDASQAYMRAVGYDWEIRFDIVSVIGVPGGSCQISLFRDAFFPGLGYGSEIWEVLGIGNLDLEIGGDSKTDFSEMDFSEMDFGEIYFIKLL